MSPMIEKSVKDETMKTDLLYELAGIIVVSINIWMFIFGENKVKTIKKYEWVNELLEMYKIVLFVIEA